MRFFSYFSILLASCFLSSILALQSVQAKKPQTFVTLNAQQGCRVHVAAWLSPSCTHCADYFASDIPRITALPGFCVDLHFIPYLYLLDKPVSILIASQGPGNIIKNAEIFLKNQREWLDTSASREKIEERAEDLTSFLKNIENDPSKNFKKIKNYLIANDKFLYVKMFALNFFTIEHLEHYLPKDDEELINDLSIALMSDLPKKENNIVKYSPFFTDPSGQLLPDEKLYNGILTPDVAEDMLKVAGSFSSVSRTSSVPKIAKRTRDIDIDDDIQDADEEALNESPTKKWKRDESPYDDANDEDQNDETDNEYFEEDSGNADTKLNTKQKNLKDILERLETNALETQ